LPSPLHAVIVESWYPHHTSTDPTTALARADEMIE
jgi:hypothetical protein